MAAKNEPSTKFACLNVLKIGENATEDDMKLAYKNVAYMHHPDRPSEKASEDKFTEITEAYIKLRAMYFLDVPLCCVSCACEPPWEQILKRGPDQMRYFKRLFLEILTDYVLRRRFQSKKKQRLQTVEEKEEDAFYDYLRELEREEEWSSSYSSEEWISADDDDASDFESYDDWLEAKGPKKRHKHGKRKGSKRAGQSASSNKPKQLTKKQLLAAEHKRRKEMEEIGKNLLEQQKQKVMPEGTEKSKNTHHQKASTQSLDVQAEIKKQQDQARMQAVVLESKLKLSEAQEKHNEKRRKKLEMKQLKKQNQLEAKQRLQGVEQEEVKAVEPAQNYKLNHPVQHTLDALERLPIIKHNQAKKKEKSVANLPPRLQALEANKGQQRTPDTYQKVTSKTEQPPMKDNIIHASHDMERQTVKSYNPLSKLDERENFLAKVAPTSDLKGKEALRPFEVENDPSLNSYHIQQYSHLMKVQPERHTQWQLKGMGSLQYHRAGLLRKQQEKEARRNQEEMDELKELEKQNLQRNWPIVSHPIRHGPRDRPQIGKSKESVSNPWERRKGLLQELTPTSAEDEEAMLKQAMAVSMQTVRHQNSYREQGLPEHYPTNVCDMDELDNFPGQRNPSQSRGTVNGWNPTTQASLSDTPKKPQGMVINGWSHPTQANLHSTAMELDDPSSSDSSDDIPDGAFSESKACPSYTQQCPSYVKQNGQIMNIVADDKTSSVSSSECNGSTDSVSVDEITARKPNEHEYLTFGKVSPSGLITCSSNCDCFDDLPQPKSGTISNLNKIGSNETFYDCEHSVKGTESNSLTKQEKVHIAEQLDYGYSSVKETEAFDTCVKPCSQNMRDSDLGSSQLYQDFPVDRNDTSYKHSADLQTGTQKANSIQYVELKSRDCTNEQTHIGEQTREESLQERCTETDKKQNIEIAQNFGLPRAVPNCDTTNSRPVRNIVSGSNQHPSFEDQLHNDKEKTHNIDPLSGKSKDNFEGRRHGLSLETAQQTIVNADSRKEPGLSLETAQQTTKDVDVDEMNKKILGTSNIWSVNGPLDGTGDASASVYNKPTDVNVLPGLSSSNFGPLPGLPLVLPDNIALYVEYLAQQRALAMLTSFPLVSPMLFPPGLGPIPLSGVPMIPRVSPSLSPATKISSRIYNLAIQQRDKKQDHSSPAKKSSLAADSEQDPSCEPHKYMEGSNKPDTETMPVSNDTVTENKDKFEITARLPRPGFRPRQNSPDVPTKLQQTDIGQSAHQTQNDHKIQDSGNVLVSSQLQVIPRTTAPLINQGFSKTQGYPDKDGVLPSQAHEDRQGFAQKPAPLMSLHFPARHEPLNSQSFTQIRQKAESKQGFPTKQEFPTRPGSLRRPKPENRPGFPPKSESKPEIPTKQENLDTQGFTPIRQEAESRQGSQTKQECQTRPGFPRRPEHENKQGFLSRPENKQNFPTQGFTPIGKEHGNREGFTLKQESQSRQGFPPRQLGQEPENRQVFPQKTVSQIRPGFPPKEDSQTRQGFPPRQESVSRQGLPPRQESQTRQGFPPKEESQTRQGFPPRQESVSRQGFPPRQESVSRQGFPSRQESVSRQGFPSRQESVSRQGFPSRQESVSRQGFPSRQESVSRQGFPSRPPAQNSPGLAQSMGNSNVRGCPPRQGFPSRPNDQDSVESWDNELNCKQTSQYNQEKSDKSQRSPARMVRRPPQLPQFVTKGINTRSFAKIVTDADSITSRRQASPDVLNTSERRGY